MEVRPDIVVRDRTGRTVLAVEVKARRGVDARWATQLRRNLLAHGGGHRAMFFMIVTSSDVYLWREARDETALSRPPDAQAKLRDLVGADVVPGTIDGQTLELIIQSWLSAAATASLPVDLAVPASDLLVGSGLFDVLRNAVVEFEPV